MAIPAPLANTQALAAVLDSVQASYGTAGTAPAEAGGLLGLERTGGTSDEVVSVSGTGASGIGPGPGWDGLAMVPPE